MVWGKLNLKIHSHNLLQIFFFEKFTQHCSKLKLASNQQELLSQISNQYACKVVTERDHDSLVRFHLFIFDLHHQKDVIKFS